jgi:vacuolar-type H+-ATPase catalytic subunit A/Vma1
VKLGPGLYQLSYDGIARTGYTLKSSNIIVKFNGTQIHKL